MRPWVKFPLIKMSQYFPKPFRSFGENTNVKGNANFKLCN